MSAVAALTDAGRHIYIYILLFAGLATTVSYPSNFFSLPTVEQRCITTREGNREGFERTSVGSFTEDNS